MTAVWQVESLEKSYPVGRFPFRRTRIALRGASVAIRPGERVGLVGPSGSGKSSLLRCGLGLVPFDGGTVRLFGEATTGWRAHQWRTIRSRVQILFQDPKAMLHPDVPVGNLLADSASLHRPGQSPREMAGSALAEVGLKGRFHALPRELSGGEQRRVGLARVLLARPDLLVADEPTAGLDAAIKASMLELLLHRVGPACSVVLVSHDLSTVAEVCDRVLVFDEGRVVETFEAGTLRQAGWQPQHQCTAALLDAAGWRPIAVAPEA